MLKKVVDPEMIEEMFQAADRLHEYFRETVDLLDPVEHHHQLWRDSKVLREFFATERV